MSISHSAPGDGAFLSVVYQWGSGKFRTLLVSDPKPALSIDSTTLEGGKRCRFVVLYSDGLRSAGAATPFFQLPLRGATVRIVSPAADAVLVEGQPLQLEAHIEDPERSDGLDSNKVVTWWLGKVLVGRGLISGLLNPPVGEHTLRLRYEHDGTESSIPLRVKRRQADEAPAADHWQPSGPHKSSVTFRVAGR